MAREDEGSNAPGGECVKRLLRVCATTVLSVRKGV